MKKLLAVALTGCMTFGMVACGSGNDVAPAPADTAASAEETEAPADDAADNAQQEAPADSDKVWIVATDTVFRPFEFTNENGEFVGIDVDVLAAIAEDQGFKYELNSLGWDAGVDGLMVV